MKISVIISKVVTWCLHCLGRWWAFDPPWMGWLTRLAVLMVLGTFGWIITKPLYGMARRGLVERNYRAVLAASSAGDALKARELALAVILTGDKRIEMLRIMEQSAGELDDPRYGVYAANLMAHPQSTSDDRIRVFRYFARSSPFGRLQMTWKGLKDGDRHSKPFVLAMTDRMIRDGTFNQAARLLDTLPNDNLDPEVARQRFRCLVGMPSAGSLDSAQTLIVKLWRDQPDRLAEWCEMLETIPLERLDPFILSPLRPALARGIPGAPGVGELMDARIDWQNSAPEERAARLPAVLKRWQNDAPLALAKFLTAADESERLVEVLSEAVTVTNPDLIRARLEALQKLKRGGEMAQTLNTQGSHLAPMEQLAYSAIAAHLTETAQVPDLKHKGSDAPALNAALTGALMEGATSKQPDALLRLYFQMRRAGMDDQAERALVAAIEVGRGPLPSYYIILPAIESLTRKGLEKDLATVHNAYLKIEPFNPLVLSRQAYLAAIMEFETPTEVLKRLKKLIETGEPDTQLIAVVATLQTLANQLPDATKTWQRLAIPPKDLTIGFRAAHLTTEMLSGRIARNAPEVREFPWHDLLPSERNRFGKLAFKLDKLQSTPIKPRLLE